MPTFDPDAETFEEAFHIVPNELVDQGSSASLDKTVDIETGEVTIPAQIVQAYSQKEAMEGEFVKMKQDAPTSSVTLRSVFSRTVAEPNANFGSITATTEITEVLPGTLTGQEIAEITAEQFICLKREVLRQLNLQSETDDTARLVMETFPGSRAVHPSNGPVAPVLPQDGPAALPRTFPTVSTPQPVSGPHSGPTGQAATGRQKWTGQRRDLWSNMLDFPDRWFFDEQKGNANAPDFLSLDYVNDRGYPDGLWLTYQGQSQCPNPDLLNQIYQAGGFAKNRPGRG